MELLCENNEMRNITKVSLELSVKSEDTYEINQKQMKEKRQRKINS